MWGWDGLIAALLGIAAWRMAYLGVRVTIHPPGTQKGRTKRSIITEFYVIAAVSTILVLFQAYRTNKAYSDLLTAIQRNQSPSVILSKMGLGQSVQYLLPDQNFLVGMTFQVSEGTAKDLDCEIYAFDLPGDSSLEQNREAIKQMKVKTAEDGEAVGTDALPGGGCERGWNLRFNQDQIQELIDTGQKPVRRIIYLTAHLSWKNDAGADFQKDECFWMEPPKSNVVDTPGWHECGR
jgi:hypothetical protein